MFPRGCALLLLTAALANRPATFLLNADGEPTRLQFLDVEFERIKTP